MDKNKTCTFAGHSQLVPASIYETLFSVADYFTCSVNEPNFLVGGMGEFDDMSVMAVRKLKKKYPLKSIRLCLVCPYMSDSLNRHKDHLESTYDEIVICDQAKISHYKAAIKIRNRYMVDSSSLVIGFVFRNFGGAYETLKYAEKQKNITIINLAGNIGLKR